MANVPTSLNNLKTKVNYLDFDKLKTVSVDLKTLSYIVGNEVGKNTKFNTLKTKVINLEKKIPGATNLIHVNQHNTDKTKFRQKNLNLDKKSLAKKIPDTNGLVATTVLKTKISEVDNKIPGESGLVTITDYTKISEVKKKSPNSK